MRLIFKLLGGIETAAELLSGFAMLVIAALVFLDVLFRYVLGAPSVWTYDLIGRYLMVLLFYGMLSATHAKFGHVRVDILQSSMTLKMRHASEMVTSLLALIAFGLLSYLMFSQGFDAFEKGHATSGAVAWPSWPPYIIAAVGSALLTARLCLNFLVHLISVMTGRPAELPPLAGDNIKSGVTAP